MKIIVGERQSGKTTELLQLAVDEGYIFVAHDKQEIERLKKICQDANLEPPVFITHGWLLTGESLKGFKKINGLVIDNVDYLLNRLSNVEIKAIAINELGNEDE